MNTRIVYIDLYEIKIKGGFIMMPNYKDKDTKAAWCLGFLMCYLEHGPKEKTESFKLFITKKLKEHL